MTSAVSTYHAPTLHTGIGSPKNILASAFWLFSASVAATRVAAAVRNHCMPVEADLAALGLDAAKFPRP